MISRLLVAAALVAATAACLGCAEACGSGTTKASDQVRGADAAAPDDEATPAGDTEAGETADAGEAVDAEQNGGEEEAPPAAPTCMLDVFRQLEVGDWVRTGWTNKEKHTLLVAARTDETITIEEIVEDRGFTKAWTQLDVSLADGTLVALRERLANGTIEAREPTAESQRGTSDLLLEPFRPDGRADVQIKRIEVYAAGVAEPEIKRGLFLCRRYKITVEEDRYAHLWFSRVKLPDYPVKIHYYEENLTILLEAFGSGRASEFTKKPEPRRRGRTRAE